MHTGCGLRIPEGAFLSHLAEFSPTWSSKLENGPSFFSFPSYRLHTGNHISPTWPCKYFTNPDPLSLPHYPRRDCLCLLYGPTDHAPLMPDFVHFSPCPALHPHPFPDCSRQRYPKPASDRAAFLPKAFLAVFYVLLLFPIFCSIFW